MSSRASSFLNPVFTNGQISLVDTEQPAFSPEAEDVVDSSERPAAPSRASTNKNLTKTFTSGSLRSTVREQKATYRYGKYRRDRYEEAPADRASSSTFGAQDGSEAAKIAQKGYLERGKDKATKARALIRRKKTLHKAGEEDAVIDILYENERGAFLFGIPKFSSSSLLNFDPQPWLNADFRTSPVDIRNAQVPDPSWQWVWKTWYVDMSHDVDEEGWEYSFMFQNKFNWHGNHPWFHSFVRRRRWLRRRVRKDPHLHKTQEKSHELTAEYFTIHPRTVRTTSMDGSTMLRSEAARAKQEDEDLEQAALTNMADLMHLMRKAAVDREKLVSVRRFVDGADEELYYLAGSMEEIMSLFIFQSSRRQLLAELLQHFDGADARKKSLESHDHAEEDEARTEHERATRHAANLLRAVKAADDQVKKLEYWSDIKSMAKKGQTLDALQDYAWQGVDDSAQPKHEIESFKSKQKASDGAGELHPHPEHPEEEECEGGAAPSPTLTGDADEAEDAEGAEEVKEAKDAEEAKHAENVTATNGEADDEAQSDGTATPRGISRQNSQDTGFESFKSAREE